MNIKPLSQSDIANGWKLIVPRINRISKEIYNNKDNLEVKVMNNIYRSKINLLQLPRHLHKKQHRLYNGNIRVIEKSHHYYIESSSVDNEINELVNILDKKYDINYTERVTILLKLFQENDMHGWPVIVAKERYHMSLDK